MQRNNGLLTILSGTSQHKTGKGVGGGYISSASLKGTLNLIQVCVFFGGLGSFLLTFKCAKVNRLKTVVASKRFGLQLVINSLNI